MLHEFLSANREGLISRCRVKVSKRSAPNLTDKLQFGVPILLTELIDTLVAQDRALKDHSVWDNKEAAAIGKTVGNHGTELFLKGLTFPNIACGFGAAGPRVLSLLNGRCISGLSTQVEDSEMDIAGCNHLNGQSLLEALTKGLLGVARCVLRR